MPAALALVLLATLGAGDGGRIDALLERAETLASPQQRHADLALPLFREAVERAEAGQDIRRAARAWLGLGRALRSTHSPVEAREALDRARERAAAAGDPAGEGEALRLVATLRMEQGEFEVADRMLAGILPLADRAGSPGLRIRALNNLAASARRQGRLFEAVGLARRALDELDRERARPGSAPSGESLFAVPYNLGSSLLEGGDYRGSIVLLQRALQEADAAGLVAGRWHVLQDTAAWYQAQGDLAKAAAYYERAREAARGVESKDPEAYTLRGLASVAEGRGDLAEARRLYGEAFALFESISFGSELAATLVALGRVEGRLGEVNASRASLDRALEAAGRTGQPLAAVLAHLERAHQDEARDDTGPAAAEYRIALATARVNGLRPLEPVALLGLARLARREQAPELALRRYEEAAGAVEAMRARIPSVDLRAAFASAAHDTYAGLLSLTLELRDRRPGAAGDEAALLALERERSHSLSDEVRQSGAEGASPANVARREGGRRLSALQLRLASPETGEAERKTLLARLDDAERAQDALEGQARSAVAWKAPEGAAALLGVLRAGEAFLAYATLPERTVVFLVTRRELRVVTLPAVADLEPRIDLFARLLAGGTPEQALPAGARLSRELLAPVLGALPTGTRVLIVAASGPLAALPFAALPDPAHPSLPLVAHLSIAYLPSLTSLARLRSAPPSLRRGVLAVSGDAAGRDVVVAGRVRRLEALPGARHEIEAVARQASAVEVLSGPAAREAALRSRRLRGFSVIHLAAHAVEDPLAPTRSAILLLPGDGEDGWLQPREIYDLDLDADLVLLSGCGTAAGRPSMAEGVQGLSLAFLHAGARAAVGTAWRVEDHATAGLFGVLYERLVAGDDAGDALAGAQRACFGQEPWARAGEWAAFVLHGDPAARTRLLPAPRHPWADPRAMLASVAAAAAVYLAGRSRVRRRR
jgi:CHAT domain-containing protein/tetratricopeptide (TPR) repeat protein